MNFRSRLKNFADSVALRLFLTIGLLVFGLYDLPVSWAKGRMVKHAMKSAEMGRESAGYYEGLIGGDDSATGSLERAIVGQPSDWVHFADSGVSQLVTNDILQFILLPNVSRSLFGKQFTTNEFRLRDRPTTTEKPPGTIRIALLGASMDMGWGVATDKTYENRLEDWLNAQAKARGDHRRFEILNFAVAAYSPTQRVVTYQRVARKFKPDMIFYATTLLDPRLTEIHLGDCLNNRVDLTPFPLLASTVAESGFDPANLKRDPAGRWLEKNQFKNWIEPFRDDLNQKILGSLVEAARHDHIPVVCLIIPRAGRNDLPHLRAAGVARQVQSAQAFNIPVWDLTDSFDHDDSGKLSVAEWDDHPNTRGHGLIYADLVRHLLNDPVRTDFGLSGHEQSPATDKLD
ncbi:MAG: SGNH/GDSL hydrolase family protein [bacterium]